MKNRFLTKEPLRWFLLLWVAMAVTGTLQGNNAQDSLASGDSVPHTIRSGVYIVALSPPPADFINLSPMTKLQSVVVLKPTLPLSSILIFLLLVALYSF